MNDSQKEFFAAMWIIGIIAVVLFVFVVIAISAK